MQESLGITGTTAKEASSTIEGSVNTMKAAWENWLTSLGRSDVDMAGETEKLVDSVVTVMENLVPRVGQILGSLVTEFGSRGPEMAKKLWTSLASALPTQARPFMDGVEEIFESGLAGAITAATAAVSGANLLSKALTAMKPAAKVASSAIGSVTDVMLDLATAPSTASTMLGRLSSTLLSIPSPAVALATAVGVTLVAAFAAMSAEAAEAERRQKLLSDATESASSVLSGAVGSVEDYGESIADMRSEAEDALQSLADLNSEVGGGLRDAFADTATVDGYVATINELANKAGLSATEQYRLQEAVEGYNDIVGTQYSVIDAANGVLADQNGVIQSNTDQINANAEAWKKRATAQALSDASAKYMEEEADAAFKLQQAQDTLNESTERYNEALDNYNAITDNGENPLASGAYDAAQELNDARDAMNDARASVDDLTTAYDSASQSAEDFSSMAAIVSATYDTLGGKATDFVTSLSETGIGLETFTSMTDEQLVSIAESWDGSVQSIVDAMARLGVDVPASAYNAMGLFSEAISEGGASAITTALTVSGMTVQQFSDAVEQYGIKGDESITAFANAIAAGDTVTVAAQKAQEAASALGSGEEAAASEGAQTGQSYASGISSATGSVTSSASGLASAATSQVSGVPAEMSAKGSESGEGFASGIGSAQGPTTSAAQGLADAASTMNQGDSYSWGSDLGSQFASGISSAWGAVTSAASSLASAVASYIHFSSPEKGPWSGAEKGGVTSGRHLVENFAKGMTLAIPDIEAAAQGAMEASALDDVTWGYGMASSLPRSASTTVVQYVTYDNRQDINFEQPVRTPYETARAIRMQQTYGLAGAR